MLLVSGANTAAEAAPMQAGGSRRRCGRWAVDAKKTQKLPCAMDELREGFQSASVSGQRSSCPTAAEVCWRGAGRYVHIPRCP